MSLRPLFFACLLPVLIIGCSDERNVRSLDSVHGTISGQVYKGLVTHTTVTAYALGPDFSRGDALGSFTTDLAGQVGEEGYVPGQFVIDVGPYNGDILLEAGGASSSFRDEATGLVARFDKESKLTAVIPAFALGDQRSIVISPFSMFAHRVAACPLHKGKPVADAHKEAVSFIQGTFHIDDFLTTVPLDLTKEKATSLTEEVKFGLLLAALSQDSKTRWGAQLVHTVQYVSTLATDFDDCKADGRDGEGKAVVLGGAENNGEAGSAFYTSTIPSAIVDFIQNPQNVSGLTDDEVAPWTADLLGPTQNEINGWVYLGPLQNATVTAYAVDDTGIQGTKLGSTTTAGSGSFRISLAPFKGTVVLDAKGGSYVDEATGNILSAPASFPLHTILTGVDFGDQVDGVLISGLSELAYRKVACTLGVSYGERWSSSAQWIADYYGISGFLRGEPVDLTVDSPGATVTTALKAGLWNAAISQLTRDINLASGLPVDQYHTPLSFIYLLGDDLASDCLLDGGNGGPTLYVGTYMLSEATTRLELATAADSFLNGVRNVSGLTFSDVRTILEAFGGRVVGSMKGRAYKGLVRNYSIVANDFRGWVNSGVVAQAATGAADYTLEILNYYGPLLLTVKGASAVYRDEALDADVALGVESEGYLQAMVGYFTNGDVMPLFNVSPLSDFAYTLAACYVREGAFSPNVALNEANYQIATHFGVSGIYDVPPANMSAAHYAGTITDGDRFAMALAGISSLAERINGLSGIAPISSIKLVRLLAEDLAADCLWDGQSATGQLSVGAYNLSGYTMRLELAQALYTWMSGPHNGSGISATTANPYYASLAANASTMFPVSQPPIDYDLAAPTVTPTIATGTWVKGTIQVEILGTDQSPIATLAVTAPSAVAALTDQDSSPGRINIFLDTSSLADGPLTMWIHAVDQFANGKTQKYVLNIDNATPALTNVARRVSAYALTLTGGWTAPSGITSITATPQAATAPVYVGSVVGSTYSIPVTLALEGVNTFAVKAINTVGTAATFSQTVTRDTTGPAITLGGGVHTWVGGTQAYTDAALARTDISPAAITWSSFVFYTRYADAGSFTYTDTLFPFSATDAFGSSGAISKSLFKLVNGDWAPMTPFNTSLPYLGQDVFGNNLNQSSAFTTAPTVWRITAQSTDDLGNTATKHYVFRVYVEPPPLTLINLVNGLLCPSAVQTSKAYLGHYNAVCYNETASGRAVSDLLTTNISGWVNGKNGVFSAEFKNESSVAVYFDPVSFASDYMASFSSRSVYMLNKWFYNDTVNTNAVLSACGNYPYWGRQTWVYGTSSWTAMTCPGTQTRNENLTYTAASWASKALSYVVTNTSNGVLSANADGTYTVAAGASIRLWVLASGPIATYGFSQQTNGFDNPWGGNGNIATSYLGYRVYIYYDYSAGTSSDDQYYRFIEYDVWAGVDVSYNPPRSGQAFRYATRAPWDPAVPLGSVSASAVPGSASTFRLDMARYGNPWTTIY